MNHPFRVVIPARYASSRLPGKPLVDIHGSPMFMHVYRRARASGAQEVIVATDDARIIDAAREHGAHAELTAADHESGTDRIAELAQRLGWGEEDIVVNVQGDEPLIEPRLIDQVAQLLADTPEAAIATLTTPLRSAAEFEDPNMVKVVTDRSGFALYFSRAPIPYPRDGQIPSATRRHVGIYAYRVAKLCELAAAPVCELEAIERLEQLRALWLGERIAVQDASVPPPTGVDTPADLEAVRRLLAGVD